MKKILLCYISLLVTICTPISILASTSENNLTPYGGQQAGNPDKSIPAWQGASSNPQTLDAEIKHSSTIYQINKSNIEQYKNILPQGLYALIYKYPKTMVLNVFPSFRPAYYPEWIYAFAKKNITSVKIVDGALINTFPAPPFIHPKDGVQVVWNHLLAFKGVSAELKVLEVTRRKSNKYTVFNSKVSLYVNYYNRARAPSQRDAPYVYYLSKILSPSKAAGGALLLHEQVNASVKPRQAWAYLPGQRRIRRIPGVDFDSPMQISESIRFADEINLFNGSIDHYNWRIIAKKELIVPYNNMLLSKKLSENNIIDKELITKNHPNPQYLRYEKHRVWVVEGILKAGKNHAYKRRRFYIDEDSWLILVAENYNSKNKLWRVSASYTKQYHNIPAIFTTADVFHDLQDEIYYFQGIEKLTTSETLPPKAKFMPSALRRGNIR